MELLKGFQTAFGTKEHHRAIACALRHGILSGYSINSLVNQVHENSPSRLINQ